MKSGEEGKRRDRRARGGGGGLGLFTGALLSKTKSFPLHPLWGFQPTLLRASPTELAFLFLKNQNTDSGSFLPPSSLSNESNETSSIIHKAPELGSDAMGDTLRFFITLQTQDIVFDRCVPPAPSQHGLKLLFGHCSDSDVRRWSEFGG